MKLLAEKIELINQAASLELRGTVVHVRGLAVHVADLPVPIGADVTIHPAARNRSGGTIDAEVVGFDQDQTIVMPFGATQGVRRGDWVIAGQAAQTVRVGPGLLGRVLNGFGRPIDQQGPLPQTVQRPLYAPPIDPMTRPLIQTPLATGVRAIDALATIGRGQRIGVFAAPGIGKSTLLAMMAKHTVADVSVIALVGERGREVRDFIDNILGPEGLAKSVVICATSDEPALLRIRGAMVACAVAEHFRDQGADVLLIMDSITRFCQAQREVGLAAGEPPATKGYPPSVFAMLPRLLERSGRTNSGSITAMYAVLVEGEDLAEPISEASRAVLDGHVLLDQQLANRGHWPAIDLMGSISRLCDQVIDPEHAAARQQILKLIAAYHEVEDLLNIGAYAAGSNSDYDLAIACKAMIDQLVQQGRNERVGSGDFQSTRNLLVALSQRIEVARQQLAGGRRSPVPGDA